MNAKVNWVDADETWPEEPGTYLTCWSDGALETYQFDNKDIERGYITMGADAVLFWAENVQPPDT